MKYALIRSINTESLTKSSQNKESDWHDIYNNTQFMNALLCGVYV